MLPHLLKKSDDQLISYLKKNKTKFFRGDLENVALRLYETANKNKAKYFVRISGDSPMIDPKLIDKAIKISKKIKSMILLQMFFKNFSKWTVCRSYKDINT